MAGRPPLRFILAGIGLRLADYPASPWFMKDSSGA